VGLADIAANATGAVDGVLNAFGASDTPAYPKALGQSVSNVIIENDKSWRKSLGYVFQVVRVQDGEVSDADGWQEFVLQINPQDLSQDEIFAIEVTPTFSGVLVEHQGTTLKDISISGTTGISPHRRAGGAFPQSGRPVFAAGRSGYMEFHELRTYIRAYVEQKRNDPDAANDGELRLVWRNLRDHEDLFVEPQRFTMKRSASKPLLYDYSINLKAIGIAKLVAKDKGFLASIDGAIEDITGALQAVSQVIAGAFDFVKLVDENIENTILGPINAITQGIQAFNNGKANQKSFAATVAALKKKIDNNFAAVGVGNDAQKQKALKAEKATQLQAAVASAQQQQFAQKTLTALQVQKLKDAVAVNIAIIEAAIAAKNQTAAVAYSQQQVLNALKQTKIAADKALQTAKLFAQNSKVKADVVNAVYAASAANAATAAAAGVLAQKKADLVKAQAAGDSLAAAKAKQSIAEIVTAKAQAAAKASATAASAVSTATKMAKTVTIDGGMTIQALAAFFMGDPSKYKDIAFYNGLKAPYVDTTPLDVNPVRIPGVARPGDKLLIPQNGSPSTTFNTVTKPTDPPIVFNLPIGERKFGVDFQLTDDFDLAVSNTNDIKLVAGSANIGQRIAVKLLLDPGSLKYHQSIGVGLKIGERLHDDLDKIIGRIRLSLQADNAIDSVIFASVAQAGSTLMVNMILKLKDVDEPLTVPVKVA